MADRRPLFNTRYPITGARLPVVIDPKRPHVITVDWPSAAEAAAAG